MTSLSCRCIATREANGWRIQTAAGYCVHSHKTGDFVSNTAEAWNAMIEAEWDRAERDYYEGVA